MIDRAVSFRCAGDMRRTHANVRTVAPFGFLSLARMAGFLLIAAAVVHRFGA